MTEEIGANIILLSVLLDVLNHYFDLYMYQINDLRLILIYVFIFFLFVKKSELEWFNMPNLSYKI